MPRRRRRKEKPKLVSLRGLCRFQWMSYLKYFVIFYCSVFFAHPLLQIFGHLLPLDILHLARTTKDFRRVLLHKSSISVWKSARENIAGLPECPSSMSEPAYANLAFDQHCHVSLLL